MSTSGIATDTSDLSDADILKRVIADKRVEIQNERARAKEDAASKADFEKVEADIAKYGEDG